MFQNLKYFLDGTDFLQKKKKNIFNWRKVLNLHEKIEHYSSMHSKKYEFDSSISKKIFKIKFLKDEQIRSIFFGFLNLKSLSQKEIYEWSLFQEPRIYIPMKKKLKLKEELKEKYMFPREQDREEYLYYYCSEY